MGFDWRYDWSQCEDEVTSRIPLLVMVQILQLLMMECFVLSA